LYAIYNIFSCHVLLFLSIINVLCSFARVNVKLIHDFFFLTVLQCLEKHIFVA